MFLQKILYFFIFYTKRKAYQTNNKLVGQNGTLKTGKMRLKTLMFTDKSYLTVKKSV